MGKLLKLRMINSLVALAVAGTMAVSSVSHADTSFARVIELVKTTETTKGSAAFAEFISVAGKEIGIAAESVAQISKLTGVALAANIARLASASPKLAAELKKILGTDIDVASALKSPEADAYFKTVANKEVVKNVESSVVKHIGVVADISAIAQYAKQTKVQSLEVRARMKAKYGTSGALLARALEQLDAQSIELFGAGATDCAKNFPEAAFNNLVEFTEAGLNYALPLLKGTSIAQKREFFTNFAKGWTNGSYAKFKDQSTTMQAEIERLITLSGKPCDIMSPSVAEAANGIAQATKTAAAAASR